MDKVAEDHTQIDEHSKPQMANRREPTKVKASLSARKVSKPTRSYVSQTDVPRVTLTEALRIAQAISDNYAGQPSKPLWIAQAIGVAPTTGSFRNLTSASSAYGLTEGAAWAAEVSLTELGRRIVAPTKEGDDSKGRVEAVLRPRIIRDFLTKYNGSKFPPENIALNVLQASGIPAEACSRALSIIRGNAEDLGLLREINGQLFVDLQSVRQQGAEPRDHVGKDKQVSETPAVAGNGTLTSRTGDAPARTKSGLSTNRRVFITHGSNQAVLQQLKELLTFGDFEPIISIERESLAKSVPDKVLDDMRSCGAAIVHVGSERKLLDTDGNEVHILNSNVLIEIGAAMALYGRRFILLVERGVTLPSNLQGLYEVRYEGSKLDYESTMKLLKAFNEFKA